MAKTTTRKKSQERKRIPFGGHRTKLQTDPIKGYVCRWFNDTEDRIKRAEDAGYEFVKPNEIGMIGEGEILEDNSDLNSKVSKIVSRGRDNPMRAYLMKIRQDWYDEDQADKEERNRMVDDALRAGKPGGNEVENQYIPRGHTNRV